MTMQSTVPEVRRRGPRKPYRLGGKLKRALGHLTDGRGLVESALLAKMSPQGLRAALRKPHVMALVTEDARARLTGLLPKAASTVERILDSDNAMAALNASKFALGVHEIAPPERGASVAISVDVRPGFVIDLRPDDGQPLPAADTAKLGGGAGLIVDCTADEVEQS